MISKEIGKELNRETRQFTRLSDNDKMIRETLLAVYTALIEKGYNPISQIVGYILSEDPTYITNHKNARNLITRFDRDELLEALVKYYLGVATVCTVSNSSPSHRTAPRPALLTALWLSAVLTVFTERTA